MSKVLVIYKDNWADEFDIEGFRMMQVEDWEDMKSAAREIFVRVEKRNTEKRKEYNRKKLEKPDEYHYFDEEEEEFYFGTNEAIHYSSYKDWLDAYIVKEITDEKAKELEELFDTGYGLGIFIEP